MMPGDRTMGASKQDSAAMMEVYSLETWEVQRHKPSSGWFIYQNESGFQGDGN
jgi:hypothetical protein